MRLAHAISVIDEDGERETSRAWYALAHKGRVPVWRLILQTITNPRPSLRLVALTRGRDSAGRSISLASRLPVRPGPRVMWRRAWRVQLVTCGQGCHAFMLSTSASLGEVLRQGGRPGLLCVYDVTHVTRDGAYHGLQRDGGVHKLTVFNSMLPIQASALATPKMTAGSQNDVEPRLDTYGAVKADTRRPRPR